MIERRRLGGPAGVDQHELEAARRLVAIPESIVRQPVGAYGSVGDERIGVVVEESLRALVVGDGDGRARLRQPGSRSGTDQDANRNRACNMLRHTEKVLQKSEGRAQGARPSRESIRSRCHPAGYQRPSRTQSWAGIL